MFRLSSRVYPMLRGTESKMKFSFAFAVILSLIFAGGPSPVNAQVNDETLESLILDESTGKVQIDFNDAPLTTIIDAIAKLTGKNFIYDDRVRGKVTIISPRQVTKDEAWAVFESVLKIKGFTAIPGPAEVFKIVPVRDAKESNIETVLKGEPSANRDQYVTRMIPLYYIDAQAISTTLKPLISKDASMVLYVPTNTIILTDTKSNIGRLLGILEALDVETHKEELAVIKVLYADAKTLGSQISNIYGGSAAGGASTATAARTARSNRRKTAGSSTGAAGGLEAAQRREVRIITEGRTNSLIILASRTQIVEIRKLIRKLDVPIVGGGRIHVYYLKHADAQEMSKTLSSLVGGGGGGGAGRTGRAGAGAAAGGSVALRSVVTPLAEGKISLSADPATNSLVIQASKEAYETLVNVIRKLDVARPQVLVEALIIEIDITDGFALGFSFGYMAVNNDISWDVSGAALAAGAAGALVSATKTTLEFDNGTDEPPTSGSKVTASMQAAAADNRIKILSAPHILTSDNEEAEIRIGDNIPIVSGRRETNNANDGILVNVDRKDIGVTLRVTPQISDGETFRLKIFLEITEINEGLSAAVAGGDAENVTDIGVALSNRRIENTVVVADGDTVLIGGLIGEVATNVEQKVPFFGDIPVIGWLFKSIARETRRTNLVVLLSPTIVRNPMDLEHETIKRRHEFARYTDIEGEISRMEREVLRGNMDVDPKSMAEEAVLDHTLQYPLDRMSEIEEQRQTDRAELLAFREAEINGPQYEIRALLRDETGAPDRVTEIIDLGYEAKLVTSVTEQGVQLEIIVGPFPSLAQAESTVIIMQRAMSLDPYVQEVVDSRREESME
jgi:general secretion pathway protein D